MSNPNSLIVRIRRYISGVIEPLPDEGEGWCIRCSLNGGRSLIIPESGVMEHVEKHPPGTVAKILTN